MSNGMNNQSPPPSVFAKWQGKVDRNFNDLAKWTADADRRLDGLDARIGGLDKAMAVIIRTGGGDLGTNEARALRSTIDSMQREHSMLRNEIQRLHDQDAEIGSRTVEAVRALEANAGDLEGRMRELSFHVGIYDEMVQGLAIRPQHAVPALVKDRKTGAAYVNPVKVHTRPFWLASSSRTIVVPANQKNRIDFTVPVEENLEGDMEIYALELARATSRAVRVLIQHTGLGGLQLMNAPVHMLSVFGNMQAGAQPFGLYETIFVEPGQQLSIEFTDFSGADNTIEVIVHGRRFLGYGTSGMDRRGIINTFSRNVWPFWLTTDEVLLLGNGSGAGTTTSATFTVNRQFHFEAAKAMRFGTISGVPAMVPWHVQLNEGQSGRMISDNVPDNCFAGDGNFPFPIYEPYLMLRGTSLRAVFTNDNGLANQTVDVVLHGRGLPVSFPNQRTLEPAIGRSADVLMPPSHKDLSIERMVSM